MTRVVVQVRCHDVGQKVRWEAAAAARGLSLSGWLRGAAEDQVALEVAVAREAEAAGGGLRSGGSRSVSPPDLTDVPCPECGEVAGSPTFYRHTRCLPRSVGSLGPVSSVFARRFGGVG